MVFPVCAYVVLVAADQNRALLRAQARILISAESISVTEKLINRKKERGDLKIKRNKLFEQFERHPVDTRLALAIKVIDDQLAECHEQVRTENKKAGIREKNDAPLRKNSTN